MSIPTQMSWQDQARANKAAEREQRRRDEELRAAQRRADYEAAAARKRADQSAAAELRRADLAAAEERRRARRDERDERRAALLARLPELGMSILWATMIVLPITLAWQAQAEFAANSLHIPTPWNQAFPAAIEIGAWVCAFEAHRRIRAGLDAGSLPRWMWVLASIAAVINAAHGTQDAGLPGGLALGALSLLGVLLHSIRQSLDSDVVRGTRTPLAAWRRVRYPRLSLAAASIRAARGVPAAEAWTLAWIDRFGVGPDASRRDRVLGKLIVRKQLRDDRKAAKAGELHIFEGRVQQGFAPAVKAFVDRERAAALEQAAAAEAAALSVVHEAQAVVNAAAMVWGPDALTEGFARLGTPGEQAGRLSQRAAELLPELQQAINDGTVRRAPSVDAIRRWCREARSEGLGVPVAQELRDAVARLHLVDDGQDDEQIARGA